MRRTERDVVEPGVTAGQHCAVTETDSGPDGLPGGSLPHQGLQWDSPLRFRRPRRIQP